MSLFPNVYVYTYIGLKPILAGSFAISNGVGRFRYADSYLGIKEAYPLDPENLPLSRAVHTATQNNGVFGVFLDSHAQEWGRLILNQVMQVKGVGRAFSLDQLAADPHLCLIYGSGFGTGCLRYDETPNATALELEPDSAEFGFNTMKQIRRIAVVLGSVEDGRPLPERCRRLLIPGMSLGGARPKALVHIDGHPWIAKFSRRLETIDSPNVEFAVSDLARNCGIQVAEFARQSVPDRDRPAIRKKGAQSARTVYLSRRFDRSPSGAPLHFLSAASMLSAPAARVGAISHADYSYTHIADLIRRHSSQPQLDCVELFRRMVFNILMGIRDDHLSNHGFLLDFDTKFRLSPAYDLAIDPQYAHVHDQQIRVGRHGRASTLTNALSSCSRFGLSPAGAARLVYDMATRIADWPARFEASGIRESDRLWAARLIMADPQAKALAAAAELGISDFKPPSASRQRIKSVT